MSLEDIIANYIDAPALSRQTLLGRGKHSGSLWKIGRRCAGSRYSAGDDLCASWTEVERATRPGARSIGYCRVCFCFAVTRRLLENISDAEASAEAGLFILRALHLF